MEDSSLIGHIKSIYTYLSLKEPEWQGLAAKVQVQLSKNTLKLFILMFSIAYMFSENWFLNACAVFVIYSFVLIFCHEKTLKLMKFFAVVASLGVPWLRLLLIGKETALFNHTYTTLTPIFVMLFTGSYSLSSLCFVYVLIFNKYSSSYIIQEYTTSGGDFSKMFSYYMDTSYLSIFMIWGGLSLNFFYKQYIFAQLWAKQKETEDLYKQVQKKNEQLEKFYKTKNKFFLSISHEFRNPINAALGNLELASERIQDPTTQKYITNSRVSIGLLFHLVTNILDAHKLEAGNLDWNIVPKSSKGLFSKVWEISKNLLDKQNLIGEFYVHKQIPRTLNLDSHYMLKIFLNLILNAIKYTQQGGIMIVVSWISAPEITEDMLKPTHAFFKKFLASTNSIKSTQDYSNNSRQSPQQRSHETLPILETQNSVNDIDIPLEHSTQTEQLRMEEKLFHRSSYESMENFRVVSRDYDKFSNKYESTSLASFNHIPIFLQEDSFSPSVKKEGFLKIEVFDSGRGINDNIKGCIFKQFSSICSENEDRLGLGLGLWLTKSICEAKGGQVKAFSEKDRGSQFVIIIPVETAPSVQSFKSSKPATQTVPQTLSALVVDDDKYNREISSLFLSKVGVEVKNEATNGQEAVNMVITNHSKPYDFILMDLEMPIMNGKEAVKKIRDYETINQRLPSKIVIATGNIDLEEYTACMDPNGEIRADLFYRKPLRKKDFEDIVEILQKEKAEQRTCIVINGDTLMLEFLQNSLKNHKVHIIALDNLQEAAIVAERYKETLKWILTQIDPSEEFESFVTNLKKDFEIIGFAENFTLELRNVCKELGIENTLNYPLTRNEIEKTLLKHETAPLYTGGDFSSKTNL